MTAQSADPAREPLGIVFLTLQVVEETKELVPGSIPFEFAVQRFVLLSAFSFIANVASK